MLYLRIEGKPHTESEVDESKRETHNEIDRSKDVTKVPTRVGEVFPVKNRWRETKERRKVGGVEITESQEKKI